MNQLNVAYTFGKISAIEESALSEQDKFTALDRLLCDGLAPQQHKLASATSFAVDADVVYLLAKQAGIEQVMPTFTRWGRKIFGRGNNVAQDFGKVEGINVRNATAAAHAEQNAARLNSAVAEQARLSELQVQQLKNFHNYNTPENARTLLREGVGAEYAHVPREVIEAHAAKAAPEVMAPTIAATPASSGVPGGSPTARKLPNWVMPASAGAAGLGAGYLMSRSAGPQAQPKSEFLNQYGQYLPIAAAGAGGYLLGKYQGSKAARPMSTPVQPTGLVPGSYYQEY